MVSGVGFPLYPEISYFISLWSCSASESLWPDSNPGPLYQMSDARPMSHHINIYVKMLSLTFALQFSILCSCNSVNPQIYILGVRMPLALLDCTSCIQNRKPKSYPNYKTGKPKSYPNYKTCRNLSFHKYKWYRSRVCGQYTVPKNNLNLRIKTEHVRTQGWSRCIRICLVSGPDIYVPLYPLQPWQAVFYTQNQIIFGTVYNVVRLIRLTVWGSHAVNNIHVL